MFNFKSIEELTKDFWANTMSEQFNSTSWAVDYYTENDLLVVEVAVVGKTKDDISIKRKRDGNQDIIVIDIKDTDNDSVSQDRVYSIKKIKKAKGSLEVAIGPKYNTDNLTAKCENGLLKITIPKFDEYNETEYTIS